MTAAPVTLADLERAHAALRAELAAGERLQDRHALERIEHAFAVERRVAVVADLLARMVAEQRKED